MSESEQQPRQDERDEPSLEQWRREERKKGALLLASAGLAAVQAFLIDNPQLAAEQWGLQAVVLTGAAVTVFEGMGGREAVARAAGEAGAGVVEAGQRVRRTVAELRAQGATGLEAGMKAVSQAGAEVAGGLGVIASEVTKSGRERVEALNALKKRKKEMTPQVFAGEILERYRQVSEERTQRRQVNAALYEVCTEVAADRGLSEQQLEAVLIDREQRLSEERGRQEDNISRWIKVRRFMASITIRPMVNLGRKVDETVYGYVFAGARARVESRIEQTKGDIEKNRSVFLNLRIDEKSGGFGPRGHTLSEYDQASEQMAAEVIQLATQEEVMTRYYTDMVGDTDEAGAGLVERVEGKMEQRERALREAERREREKTEARSRHEGGKQRKENKKGRNGEGREGSGSAG